MVEAIFSLILLLLASVFFIGLALVGAFYIGVYGLRLIDYLERWYKSKEL